MYDLAAFGKRVKELCRQSHPYDDGRRANQTDLANAVGLSMTELNRRLNGAKGSPLSDDNIRAIVRTLAEWGAISTQAEALDLLDLVCCPQFSANEWNAPPLDSLASLRPAPASPIPTRAEKTNLPLLLTSFVGRSREVATVTRLLGETRLLTLTGPGGVGKTRLALMTVEKLIPRFADGVWLVELAGLIDPQLAVQAIASVLNVKEQAGTPLLETLIETLEQRETLLLLDNCEHLLLAVAQTAHRLLSYCPRLRVLTTSREALRIQGEVRYSIPPLALPTAQTKLRAGRLISYPAIRLFVERASAVWPAFQLDESNAVVVRGICEHLDGLPLAIELIAARVGAMTVAQIHDALADRLALFNEADRLALPRQQTLYALIDWSYSLLTAEEQRLFIALAVFAGGFVLEAAQAVAASLTDAGESVAALLGQLVDKSLIGRVSADDHRYRMLETIREFALARLAASSVEQAAHANHAAYYLTIAEATEQNLRGPQQIEWLMRLEQEHDNIRAALRWSVEQRASEIGLGIAAALWRFWWLHGYLSEGSNWLNQTLAMADAAPPSLQAKAYNAAGNLAQIQSDYAIAINHYERGLALWSELGDLRGVAAALTNLASMNSYQRDYDTARRLYEESIAIQRTIGDRSNLPTTLSNLASLVRGHGDYATARTLYEESLALDREFGNRTGVASLLNDLGNLLLDQGDRQGARGLLTESLRLRMELQDKWSVANSLESIGELAVADGYVVRATRLLGVAEAARAEVNMSLHRSDIEEHESYMATIHAQLDDAAFATAWAMGQAMSLEQAIAYALEEDAVSDDSLVPKRKKHSPAVQQGRA